MCVSGQNASWLVRHPDSSKCVSSHYIKVVNWYHFPSCINKASVPTITPKKMSFTFLVFTSHSWKTCYKQPNKQLFLQFHVPLYNTFFFFRNIPYSIKQAFKLPIKSGVVTIEIVSYYFSPFRKTRFLFFRKKDTCWGSWDWCGSSKVNNWQQNWPITFQEGAQHKDTDGQCIGQSVAGHFTLIT